MLQKEQPRYRFDVMGGTRCKIPATVMAWEKLESSGYHSLYSQEWVGYFYIKFGGDESLVRMTSRYSFARVIEELRRLPPQKLTTR